MENLVYLQTNYYVRYIYDCNWTRTQNHLVLKRTLNHLARFRACFEQGVPWGSGIYRVSIHSETRTWHDKNIQLTKSLYPAFVLEFSAFGKWSLLKNPQVRRRIQRSWIKNFELLRLKIKTKIWSMSCFEDIFSKLHIQETSV